MEQENTLIKRIQYASARELGGILEDYNRTTFQEYDWNIVSVKASYSSIISRIDDSWHQCKEYLDYGNETMNVYDCKTGEQALLHVRQALSNLYAAKEFFSNPPAVENPNIEGVIVEDDKIASLDKPVYTADEVKSLLGVSDSTFRRWLNGGWISYTQVEGSDKRFIQKEHLLAFLNNPKIFYPSSK